MSKPDPIHVAIVSHDGKALIAVVQCDRIEDVLIADDVYAANTIAGVRIGKDGIVTVRDHNGHEFCAIDCGNATDAVYWALDRLAHTCIFD